MYEWIISLSPLSLYCSEDEEKISKQTNKKTFLDENEYFEKQVRWYESRGAMILDRTV